MKNILLIGGDLRKAEAIQAAFIRDGNGFQLAVVATMAEARSSIQKRIPQLALLDQALMGGSTDEVAAFAGGSFPVLVLVASGQEAAGLAAVKAGAIDYLVKSPEAYQDMPHVVVRALRDWDFQVQKAEKPEAFAAGIAHEYNNLLAVMVGNLDLAMREIGPGSPVRERIMEVQTATRRATELTRRMLAYSGGSLLEFQEVYLGDLLQETVAGLAKSIEPPVSLRLIAPSALPRINADPAQVRQIVHHLVANAVEAMGSRAGNVRVGAGTMDCDTACLAQNRSGNPALPGRYVYLEVADDGCGMDAMVQTRLFDPFFSTKFAGRGLGLPAVRGLMRVHKGAILVTSKPGIGTTVRVLFPTGMGMPHARTEEAAAASAVAATPPENLGSVSGTVLVVDDEDAVRRLVAELLGAEGIQCLMARDGIEALEIYRAKGASIDAVLLDLTMPRMDGIATFIELRKLRKDVKVVLATGYDITQITKRLGGFGFAKLLQKPFQNDVLVSSVRKMLAKPAA